MAQPDGAGCQLHNGPAATVQMLPCDMAGSGRGELAKLLRRADAARAEAEHLVSVNLEWQQSVQEEILRMVWLEIDLRRRLGRRPTSGVA